MTSTLQALIPWFAAVSASLIASSAGAQTLRFQGLVVEPRVETKLGDEKSETAEIRSTPDRAAAPTCEFVIDATTPTAMARATLTLRFPNSLVIGGVGDIAFSAELKQPDAGPLLVRATILLPRPARGVQWVQIIQAPGVGIFESRSAKASNEDDQLFEPPGRLIGPDGTTSLVWRPSNADSAVPTTEPANEMRWFVPVRIGLARRVNGKTLDAGRSLTGFAIYGTQEAAYDGPLPNLNSAGVFSPPSRAAASSPSETKIDPNESSVTDLIHRWLACAEPPENATDLARLHYDDWGRKVGLDAEGRLIAHDVPPADAGAQSPSSYAWSHRDGLDSVDHCKLAEYVALKHTRDSTRDCVGRHKRREPVKLGNYVGLSRTAAQEQTTAAELKVSIESAGKASSREESGRVMEQSPAAGAPVRPGATVRLKALELYVPPPIAIGDYRNKSRAEAVKQIEQLGLRAEVRPGPEAPRREQVDRVSKQSPEPGKQLAADSSVTLEVFRAHTPTLAERAEAGEAKAQLQLADNYLDGLAGLKRDDQKAFQWARRAAEQGFSPAQLRLGYLYHSGRGTKEDFAEAAKWYVKAAAGGSATASNNLGLLYKDGRGVPQDIKRAVELFRQAAEQASPDGRWNLGLMLLDGVGIARDEPAAVLQFETAAKEGHIPAQRSLAECYATGRGIARSDELAMQWYRRAADAHDAAAQTAVGILYEEGRGAKQDFAEAAKWYRRAVGAGDRLAIIRIAGLYRSGRGVPKDASRAFSNYLRAAKAGDVTAEFAVGQMYFDGEGINQSHSDALRWWETAATKGHVDAMYGAGLQYLYGRGTKVDYTKATQWFQQAAQRGHAAAANEVGRCSEFGWGYQKDIQAATAWYERAANSGDPSGAANLGRLHEFGLGVHKDYAKAIEWYRTAIKRGSAYAQYRLGALHRKGDGVKRDYAEALRLMNEAAAAGEVGAMREVGEMYYDGDGTIKDYAQAAAWYRRAAERGDAEAQYLLGRMCDKGKGVPKDKQEARRWWQLAASQGHEAARKQLK